MLWRDTQLRLAIAGIDAPAWSVLLVPALVLNRWTILLAVAVIGTFGVIRFFGVTPTSLLFAVRTKLLGNVRSTLIRPNLWRARMRRL